MCECIVEREIPAQRACRGADDGPVARQGEGAGQCFGQRAADGRAGAGTAAQEDDVGPHELPGVGVDEGEGAAVAQPGGVATRRVLDDLTVEIGVDDRRRVVGAGQRDADILGGYGVGAAAVVGEADAPGGGEGLARGQGLCERGVEREGPAQRAAVREAGRAGARQCQRLRQRGIECWMGRHAVAARDALECDAGAYAIGGVGVDKADRAAVAQQRRVAAGGVFADAAGHVEGGQHRGVVDAGDRDDHVARGDGVGAAGVIGEAQAPGGGEPVAGPQRLDERVVEREVPDHRAVFHSSSSARPTERQCLDQRCRQRRADAHPSAGAQAVQRRGGLHAVTAVGVAESERARRAQVVQQVGALVFDHRAAQVAGAWRRRIVGTVQPDRHVLELQWVRDQRDAPAHVHSVARTQTLHDTKIVAQGEGPGHQREAGGGVHPGIAGDQRGGERVCPGPVDHRAAVGGYVEQGRRHGHVCASSLAEEPGQTPFSQRRWGTAGAIFGNRTLQIHHADVGRFSGAGQRERQRRDGYAAVGIGCRDGVAERHRMSRLQEIQVQTLGKVVPPCNAGRVELVGGQGQCTCGQRPDEQGVERAPGPPQIAVVGRSEPNPAIAVGIADRQRSRLRQGLCAGIQGLYEVHRAFDADRRGVVRADDRDRDISLDARIDGIRIVREGQAPGCCERLALDQVTHECVIQREGPIQRALAGRGSRAVARQRKRAGQPADQRGVDARPALGRYAKELRTGADEIVGVEVAELQPACGAQHGRRALDRPLGQRA